MKKILKIGIVGFSKNQFDQKKARDILKNLFTDLKDKHPNKEIEIVSGFTNSGIPKIAYELADDLGFTTIGFSAKQAFKVRSGIYPVHKTIIYGQKFGDESEEFIKYIDGLIRVGGGKQSRHETELFKEFYKDKPLDSIFKEYEIDWYGK